LTYQLAELFGGTLAQKSEKATSIPEHMIRQQRSLALELDGGRLLWPW
jgi:hypothetical protein